MSSPLLTSDSAALPSLAPPAAAFSSCPLLRSLRNDCDIQFELLRFLRLNEISILARSHRLWSVWLDADRALSKRYREVRPSRFPLLLACPWAVRPIDSISFQPERFDEPDDASSKDLSLDERNRIHTEALHQALRDAGTFFVQQLMELDFTVTATPNQEAFFETCFRPWTKLSWLRVDLPDTGGTDSIGQHILRGLESVKSLTSIKLFGLFDQPRAVDLSGLPSLPALQTVELFIRNYDHQPTSAQLDCIRRCPALTELGLGNWCAEDCAIDDEDADKTIEERLEAGIGCLVRRQQESDASAANPPALTSIEWYGTRMTPALWNHVSQLTSLETLFLNVWSAGMSADQWAQLPRFSNLIDISIYPDVMEEDGVTSVLRIEEFLPSLVQCKTLEQIQLGEGLLVTAAHLESIARGLPNLTRLTLHRARVESLLPLLDAPVLGELLLNQCTGLSAKLVQFRVGFPALATLESLEIEDRWDFVETPEQLAVLKAHIRAVCPKLVTFTELVAPWKVTWIEPQEDAEEADDDGGEWADEDEQEEQPVEALQGNEAAGPAVHDDPPNAAADQSQ